MACCADTTGLSMTMLFNGARPIITLSPISACVSALVPLSTIKLAIVENLPRVYVQSAVLCQTYTPYCLLRDLRVNVSRNFRKKLESSQQRKVARTCYDFV